MRSPYYNTTLVPTPRVLASLFFNQCWSIFLSTEHVQIDISARSLLTFSRTLLQMKILRRLLKHLTMPLLRLPWAWGSYTPSRLCPGPFHYLSVTSSKGT